MYKGGDLMCCNEDENMWLTINTPNNPTVVDGRIPHKVTLVESGTRFHWIAYRHLGLNGPSQYPVYDIAQVHPDSVKMSTLEKDGYSVQKFEGLDGIHDMAEEFLFQTNNTLKSLKKSCCKELKVNWLYMENGEKIGLDENRYVMQHHVSNELVAAVTVAMGSVWEEMGAKKTPMLHDFGFMLRTDGCGKQPNHIDGEKNNFFCIIPILKKGHKYKLYAQKVSDGCYYVLYSLN